MIKTVIACVATALLVGAGTATAAKLITGKDIKNGTIQARDLAPSVKAKLNAAGQAGKNGTPGPMGPKGDTGPAGPQGPEGEKGDTGATGENGTPGRDGANPAIAVVSNGDAGWNLVGEVAGEPGARLHGGELRLGGGFDGSTPVGSIGIGKSYDAVPLRDLNALRYSMHVNKRPDDLSAPALLVTVMKANTGTQSGFANLVFEPYNNLQTTVGQPYTLDATAGKWWSTRPLNPGQPGQIDRQETVSLEDIANSSPNAVIAGISLTNGGSSSNTIPVDAFDAGADELVVGLGTELTRYDFGG